MKYPHAYSGVKKLFISEILNIISAGLMFVAVLMVLLDRKIKLPDIDTAQFWGLVLWTCRNGKQHFCRD